MKFLIPFQYFDENLPSVNTVGSHWELVAGNELRVLEGTSGLRGLWYVDDDNGLIYPDTGNETDTYWELDIYDNITPRADSGSYYSAFSLVASSTASTYEPWKAVSSDICEYGKMEDWWEFRFPYIYYTSSTDFRMGLMLISNNCFSASNTSADLRVSNNFEFASPVALNPNIVYNGTSSAALLKGTTPFTTDKRKIYAEYNMTSSWQLFRVYEQASGYGNFNNIMIGVSYTPPEGYRIEDRQYSYSYPVSTIRVTGLGRPTWLGWANNKERLTHTLEYQYLTADEKNNLFLIFDTAKSLPVWWVEDTDDTDTWRLITIPTFKLEEPVAGAFNITMELQEI